MSAMRQRLTHAQQLIWSGQAMHPGVPLFNMVLLFRISGHVDRENFESAFRSVVERSDSLSSTLITELGEVQMSVGSATGYYEYVDLGDTSYDTLENWLDERVKRELHLSDSLLDCVLVKLGTEDFAWYLNVHHLATDGYSTGIIFDRVQKAYALLSGGKPLEQIQPPQYHELLAFEDKLVGGSRRKRSICFWANVEEADYSIPKLYNRSTSLSHTRGTRKSITLDDSRMTLLREVASRKEAKGLTEQLSFHAIFSALLSVFVARVSGTSDFAISLPMHNRLTGRLKDVIGVFVELFPLQQNVDLREPFLELIQRTAQSAQKVFQHSLPGLGRTELNKRSSIVLNYVNATFGTFAGMPSRATWLQSGHVDANQALQLHVHDFNATGRLTLHFDFADDALPLSIQDSAISHFLELFDALLADPSQPVGKPGLSGGSQPEHALTTAPPIDVCQLIERQASSHRSTTAVKEHGTDWTYDDLWARSCTIASALSNEGVVTGDRVGIFLPRGGEFLASIIACLQLGAAFVPVEKGSAPARARSILRVADLKVLISDETEIVEVENRILDLATISGSRDYSPAEVKPDTPAYVMFTSGSSGIPKGVVISRRALSHYVQWAAIEYGSDSPMSMPLFTSLSYDLSVTSVFLPLVTGGCVYVYDSGDRVEQASLVRKVFSSDHHDIVKLTPSHLRVASDMKLDLTRLNCLVLGGEQLHTHLAVSVANKVGDKVRLINEYGPTEATVGCMVHEFNSARDEGEFVPIGIANGYTQIFLMDSFGNEVPDNVPGEIAIAGPGLANGYLHNQEFAASSFVEHPQKAGVTVYKTGDKAIRDQNGLMTFLGRMDEQLKIAGVRVESGEIESAICEFEGVEDSYVVTDHSPHTTLRAFYTGPADIDSSVFRQRLMSLLPPQVIPASFHRVEVFPLTANGKVDKKKLLSFKGVQSTTEPERVPETEFEVIVHQVWSELLGIPHISVDTHFFDVGGNSILAIQAVARLSHAFECEIPFSIAFESPTIKTLAAAIEVQVVAELTAASD